jgi:ribosomal-protein-alanine N-acetyltransferase
MIVRNCRTDDLESIQEIEDASFDDPFPPELFSSYLSKFPLGFRVAILENDLIGYYIVTIREESAELASIAIKKDYQGRHFGSRLMEDLLVLCRRFKAKRIYLIVRTDNYPAISLYEKFGFQRQGQIRDYYGPGRHGFKMELTLAR